MEYYLKKNSDEINNIVKEIEERDNINDIIIEQIVDDDFISYEREVLDAQIKSVLANIEVSNLDENELRKKLIEAYNIILPMGYCHYY